MTSPLDQFSSTMCFAKWTQLSIDLEAATQASCHHPVKHPIEISLLKKPNQAFNNTPYKMLMKKKMLQGQRPLECRYCWSIEDSNEPFSDRRYKSDQIWSKNRVNDLRSMPLSRDFIPSYIEVNLGRACQMKCSYCSSEISSAWADEVEKYGPYPTSGHHGKLPVRDRHQVELIRQSFLDWLPEVLPHLQVLRLTGGEPIFNPLFKRIVNLLLSCDVSHLQLAINTNLCVPLSYWNDFIDSLDKLFDQKKIKKISVFTSLESIGMRAEHIRWGLDYDLFCQRMEYLIDKHPSVEIVIMSTYNILCVQDFNLFLEQVNRWKHRRREKHQFSEKIICDISLLHYPKFLSIQLLPEKFQDLIARDVESLKENVLKNVFEDFEFEKLKRIYGHFQAHVFSDEEKKQHLDDLRIFLQEHDTRRKSDTKKVFSEIWSFL